MRIPISFEWQGKKYVGEFFAVPGSAAGIGSYWQLLIDDRFQGDLVQSADGWKFLSPQQKFEDLGDFFGDYLTAYLQ